MAPNGKGLVLRITVKTIRAGAVNNNLDDPESCSARTVRERRPVFVMAPGITTRSGNSVF